MGNVKKKVSEVSLSNIESAYQQALSLQSLFIPAERGHYSVVSTSPETPALFSSEVHGRVISI